MYFSEQLVKSLILELALKERFQPDAARNLVYHLTLPGAAVPFFVAEVLSHAPPASARPSRFPERLAYGVLDDGLARFDADSRQRRQAKVFRSINLIRLGLRRLQYPDEVVDLVRVRYSELLFAYESAARLAAESREFSGPELGVLLEKIIESAMRQTYLVLMLIEHLVERCNGVERHRLLRRVEDGIECGLRNDPFDESETRGLLIELDEPVRFRKELLSQLAFRTSAVAVLTQLSSQCR